MNVTMLKTLPDGGDYGPVIYVYRIGADSYVGKTKDGLKRAVKSYANNVRRMLEGRPYHQKDQDYRRVHYRLREAVESDERITLELIASTESRLQADKRHLIARLQPTLNK